MFIVIILVVAVVYLLFIKDNKSKSKKFSTTVFRAAATDGDNTLLASSNTGEIKKSSNNLTIDAVNTKITGSVIIGDLTISGNKICSKDGGCIEIGNNVNLVSKDRKNELRLLDNLDIAHFNNGSPVWSSLWARNPDSELNKIYVRKDKKYAIRSYIDKPLMDQSSGGGSGPSYMGDTGSNPGNGKWSFAQLD
jgi:hypothetical protein